MPTIERQGRTVHFRCEGTGPGLLLVPGLGTGARLFGTLPRRFARAGFTCAAVDPVGLPPSSPLPDGSFDFDAAAADVLAIVRTLPRPRGVVGTSLGGKVALRAAVMGAPQDLDRLILLSSAATVTARARAVHRMFELLGSAVEGQWLGELIAPFLFGATFHERHPAVVAEIVRAVRPTTESRALMRAQARALLAFDGSADADRCQVRALCLAGAEDTLTLPSEVAATAARMPHATFRSIDAAGHSLLLESAAAFAAVIEFLRAPAP